MIRSTSLQSHLYTLLGSLLAIALLLMVALFAATQYRALQSGLDHDAELVAELLVDESRGPLLFADRRILADKFRALRVYPSIRRACLYDQYDHLAATHDKGSSACPEQPGVQAEAPSFAQPQPSLRKEVLWHDVPIGHLDLYIDRSQVLSGVLGFLAPSAALALIVFLVVSIVGGRLAKRAAAPLNALTESSRNIVRGDLGVRMAVEGPLEVQELASAFNAVIDDLLDARRAAEDDLRKRRRTQEALSAAESRLRKIIDLVPYLIFAIRRDGSLIFANRAVADAYGVSIDALLSGSFANDRAKPDRPDGLLFEDHPMRRPPSEIWFNSTAARSSDSSSRACRLARPSRAGASTPRTAANWW